MKNWSAHYKHMNKFLYGELYNVRQGASEMELAPLFALAGCPNMSLQSTECERTNIYGKNIQNM